MGGDEASYTCWGEDATVQLAAVWIQGASQLNETTYNELEGRFERLLHAELALHGKAPMHWHDPIIERGIDYPRSTVVEVWDGTNRSVLSAVLAMGYPAIYAGSYYLDHLQLNWDDLYSVDPGTFNQVRALPADQQALLRGVEACMWSETVDRHNAIQKVWPRAAATAERGWSSSNTTMPIIGINAGYSPGSQDDLRSAQPRVLATKFQRGSRAHAHPSMSTCGAWRKRSASALWPSSWLQPRCVGTYGRGLCPHEINAPRPE